MIVLLGVRVIFGIRYEIIRHFPYVNDHENTNAFERNIAIRESLKGNKANK